MDTKACPRHLPTIPSVPEVRECGLTEFTLVGSHHVFGATHSQVRGRRAANRPRSLAGASFCGVLWSKLSTRRVVCRSSFVHSYLERVIGIRSLLAAHALSVFKTLAALAFCTCCAPEREKTEHCAARRCVRYVPYRTLHTAAHCALRLVGEDESDNVPLGTCILHSQSRAFASRERMGYC